MSDRLLVTGFLPFGGFDVNPSALLSASCGRRHELIEVAFDAVDTFVDRIVSADGFDTLLMFGMRSRGATGFELERRALNVISPRPDTRHHVRGPAPIDPDGPPELASTLFTSPQLPVGRFSDDAGRYLCNYAYYRALRALPNKRIGFVHVPPIDVMPIEEQRDALKQLIHHVECTGR